MRLPAVTALAALAIAFAFLIAPINGVLAQQKTKPAPQWDISEWINSSGTNIDQLRGKVVVIDFFQLWCPGCKKFSIPLVEYWEKKVFPKEIAEGRLVFVSIHTVFEGHRYQTPERLRKFIKEKGITHPVGIDRHADGKRVPETMERYQTLGTPEMAIIDKQGQVRFQRFGYFEPDYGEALIRMLLDEALKPEPASAVITR